MKEQEYILCAAILYPEYDKKVFHLPKNIQQWLVIYWPRHSHCFSILSEMKIENFKNSNIIQGFVTSKQKFVSREEAFVIAKEANQLKDVDNKKSSILFSEDLY